MRKPTILAEWQTTGLEGEAGSVSVAIEKWLDEETQVTKEEALEASGLFYDGNTTMGAIQRMTPEIEETRFAWIVTQVWYANV